MNVELLFELMDFDCLFADTSHPYSPDSTRQSNFDLVTWVMSPTFKIKTHTTFEIKILLLRKMSLQTLKSIYLFIATFNLKKKN